MKLNELKNGTLTLVTRGEDAEFDMLTFKPDCEYIKSRTAQVGDEGCLSIITDVSPNALRDGCDTVSADLLPNEGGIPGNSNSDIERLHGWRGTTNDSQVMAWGWRRVLDVQPLKRGRGWMFRLSADLKPDDE